MDENNNEVPQVAGVQDSGDSGASPDDASEALKKMQQLRQEQMQQKQKQQEYMQSHPEIQQKIKAVQEKAQFDAQNFEKRYTTKQKAEIAKWNKAQQDVDNDPKYSDEERAQAKKMIDAKKLGITPADLPKLDPHPKGQGVGDSWSDKKSGALITRRSDGSMHVLVRPDQSTPYLFAKAKQDLDMKQLEHKKSDQDALREFREKHLFETTTDADGNESHRLRSHEELHSMMQAIEGMQQQPLRTQQMRALQGLTPKMPSTMPQGGAVEAHQIPSDQYREPQQQSAQPVGQGDGVGMNGLPTEQSQGALPQIHRGGMDAREMMALGITPENMPLTTPPPGGWGPEQKPPKSQMQIDWEKEREFAALHPHDPAAVRQFRQDLYAERRQDERLKAQQEHETKLQSDKQAHEARLSSQFGEKGNLEHMKMRERFAIDKVMGSGADAGKVTNRVRSAEEIDKIMEAIAPGSTKHTVSSGPDSPDTLPMPKSAQWHHITTEAEYNRLPKGSYYVSPDGKKRRKQ